MPSNELTLPNQVLLNESGGEYNRWDGVFPKQVPAGYTPQSTGGVDAGAWLSVGDAILRGYIESNFKTKLINFESITQTINYDLLPGSTISIFCRRWTP
ncbi:hypothetical protein ACMZZG_23420 [Pseudocitrobacter faecalis]|uniref:tail fiber/spike domain-containing protein n=1 Tax=Pseudocitrobacter faecalis TaxID=1398493 RepID=UPI0039EFEFAE